MNLRTTHRVMRQHLTNVNTIRSLNHLNFTLTTSPKHIATHLTRSRNSLPVNVQTSHLNHLLTNNTRIINSLLTLNTRTARRQFTSLLKRISTSSTRISRISTRQTHHLIHITSRLTSSNTTINSRHLRHTLIRNLTRKLPRSHSRTLSHLLLITNNHLMRNKSILSPPLSMRVSRRILPFQNRMTLKLNLSQRRTIIRLTRILSRQRLRVRTQLRINTLRHTRLRRSHILLLISSRREIHRSRHNNRRTRRRSHFRIDIPHKPNNPYHNHK